MYRRASASFGQHKLSSPLLRSKALTHPILDLLSIPLQSAESCSSQRVPRAWPATVAMALLPSGRPLLPRPGDALPRLCKRRSSLASLPSDFDPEFAEEDALCEETEVDRYFLEHGRSSKTSDNTLAQLKLGKVEPDRVREVVSQLTSPHHAEIAALHEQNEHLFAQWLLELAEGFNILCYGFGSKKGLLLSFARKFLRNNPCISVNGYFESLKVSQLLKSMSQYLGFEGSFLSDLEHVAFLRETLSDATAPHIYVIIVNIEGKCLQGDLAQLVLSLLAAIPKVHLLASIDHINSTILWDHAALARFNWVFHDCTSFQPYLTEIPKTQSMFATSSTATLSSARAVLASLNSKAVKAFYKLLEYQHNHMRESDFQGLEFEEYRALCQEDFIAHEEAQLRGFMKEFSDHQLLVESERGGLQYLRVPVRAALVGDMIKMMCSMFPDLVEAS
eukprot:m.213799 g.213799  ORF g.213799 m.213799 type:complete len:448 (+) comp10763_c0_seq7:718-2061(+)